MKPAKYGPCAIACGLSLCCAFAQSPTVLTPGTSVESVEAISSGTRTTFTMTGNTILSWDQLNLAEGSELVYDFISGDRVLNLLSGSNRHTINGSVTSNGIVAFFSPNANFDMNGSITAKGVVLSTLTADADEFLSGNGYTLGGGSGSHRLHLGGGVIATQGDVVIAGPEVSLGGESYIDASGSVMIGGGSVVRISQSGEKKLAVGSTDGDIVSMGYIKGSSINLKAGGSVLNDGYIDAGEGQIYIEVGQDMQITNESNGVIIGGEIFTSEAVTAGVLIVPDEGDSAASVSQGTLVMPMLTRPDGSVVSAKLKVSANAPVSASGDSGRDLKEQKGQTPARSGKAPASGAGQVTANRAGKPSLLRRSSFFGVRGESKNVSKP